MDKTLQAPCNNDGNTVLDSRSTESAIGNEGNNAVLDEGHPPNPVDATFQDFSPQSTTPDTAWSTMAQIDDNETSARTRIHPISPIIDSHLTGARHRDMYFPIIEETTLNPEQMNQLCCCRCHNWTYEQSMVPPGQEIRGSPVERYKSQACSEEATVLFLRRINDTPCRFCKCHTLVHQDLDKDTKSKDRA